MIVFKTHEATHFTECHWLRSQRSGTGSVRGQTLQYYRSQHEARPRDAINLSAPADRTGPMELGISKLEYPKPPTELGRLKICLVVWNMNGLFFHNIWNNIIPSDELHHFSEG